MIKRFYRYDFAVTQVLKDLCTKYYGLVISAHILSYSRMSAIQLLDELGKPFFIDPMTYVFARNIDNVSKNGKPKKSYQKLAAEYGHPFSDALTSGISVNSFLKPNGSVDNSALAEMTKSVTDFQIRMCEVPSSFPKYARLLKKGNLPRAQKPSFIVPPYFFAETRQSLWYSVSLRIAQLCKEMRIGEIYPVICVSRNALWSLSSASEIARDYEGYDGYLIWISDLDEETIEFSELMGLRELITKLGESGKPVFSLYGGYLCDLLGKFGLTGYSSGVCYGEDRSVDAKTGGAPGVPRYYVPKVHLKISWETANAFFSKSAQNLKFICNCPTCSAIKKEIPQGKPKDYVDNFFAQMGFLDFRRHFVNCKFGESSSLDELTNDDIRQRLDDDIQSLILADRVEGVRQLDAIHLRRWRALFT